MTPQTHPPDPVHAPLEPVSRPGNPVAAAATPGALSVSVRSLCEFVAKRGDLDRRFTPSATALDGLIGQAGVAFRRGADYQQEVALSGVSGSLRVRGRADGYDPVQRCLEEVKTIRGHPDDIAGNRRHLHWAQLETYGALFCRAHTLDELDLALVYVDAATQAETVLRKRCSRAELDAWFDARCTAFAAWAHQEAAHRVARDRALTELPFPPGEFRPGQRALAEAVYRAAAGGRCLLAQAPTGIGKTLGTLFPMLRAMPGQQLDKIAYLTCKGTGRITALDGLQRLRAATPGRSVRVLALVAKAQACEHPDKACHGDACPLARGFYDRLPAARSDAVDEGWLDPAAQRRIALRHGICPYYLGQELLRWADVVVGDVHHAFDPNGQLFGLAKALDWRMGLLGDEAHNLVERARQMYSATLSLTQIEDAMRIAPIELRPRFARLARAVADAALINAKAPGLASASTLALGSTPSPLALASASTLTSASTSGSALRSGSSLASASASASLSALAPSPSLSPALPSSSASASASTPSPHALDTIPDALTEALQSLNSAIGDHVQAAPLATGPLLTFYFDALAMQRAIERFGTHSLFDVETPADTAAASAQITLAIRNVVPATFLRPRFAACHSATLFSATLGPPGYLRDLLGLPDNTTWLDVPPAFPPEHLQVRIAHGLSTRYLHRHASLDALVDLLATQFADHPGNYLAFFSSFDYLDLAADRLAQRHGRLPQWRQLRAMNDAARRDFLLRFAPHGQGIGFAVLGGAFAEGVDLPGTRLIGAFIATLGLPPMSPLQDRMRDRLDTLFGEGHGYADLVPGLQKVIQAAGRVLRTPEDRGWLWLLDDRYRRPEVRALLPAWWGVGEKV